MSYLVKLEKKVQDIYDDVLRKLAMDYEYPLPTTSTDATGQPTVLILGNHSSGKSSFINYLLKSDIQKTGLAPVDDGFTLITYSDVEDEFDGQTVVSHPDLPYRALERFGPDFLNHLRLKARPVPLLKSLTLIDSPGMIDSPNDKVGRSYRFAEVVRHFADMADLIIFFFDPDKPGTTGETMSVFTKALIGFQHKLLILMNKVDSFSNIRDFARAYGALCWNLSKVMDTKDLPHIYNTYIPDLVHHGDQQRSENTGCPAQQQSNPIRSDDASIPDQADGPTRKSQTRHAGHSKNKIQTSQRADRHRRDRQIPMAQKHSCHSTAEQRGAGKFRQQGNQPR